MNRRFVRCVATLAAYFAIAPASEASIIQLDVIANFPGGYEFILPGSFGEGWKFFGLSLSGSIFMDTDTNGINLGHTFLT